MILNLSDTAYWKKIGKIVAKRVLPYSFVIEITKEQHTNLDWISEKPEYICKHYPRDDYDICLANILTDLDVEFLKYFRRIKGYHACRITDESCYTQNGIIPLDEEILIQVMSKRCGNMTSLGKIKEACKYVINLYRPNSDTEGVFFFHTFEHAKYLHQKHYLEYGGEIFTPIVQRLGLDIKILKDHGRPCLIECNIPMLHLSERRRMFLWELLTVLSLQDVPCNITEKAFSDGIFGGFETDPRPVEPENICEFHYIDGF